MWCLGTLFGLLCHLGHKLFTTFNLLEHVHALAIAGSLESFGGIHSAQVDLAQHCAIQAEHAVGGVLHGLERNLVPERSRASDRVGIFGILALHEVDVVDIHPVAGHGEPEDMLPPAIYLELYKGYNDSPLPKNIVDQQLSDSISRLRAYYGISPVIFCTQRTYDLYVKNEYPDCDIWIKDVFCEPSLSDGRDWTFWQYSEKGQLPGYDGPDKYIEMDVFAGTKEEFLNYGIVNNFSDLFL